MADGFKIADGYVEIHGVVDRRSVLLAADAVTRGVSDQMTTGVAFGNLREGGRRMGAVLGEHAGPSAARETTEGLNEWIDQGASGNHIRNAGERLGDLLGRSGGSTFVSHLIEEITEEITRRAGTGGTGTDDPADADTGQRDPRDRDDGRDARDRFVPQPGRDGRNGAGSGPGGDAGTGRRGGAGADGEDAEREGRNLGERLAVGAAGSFISSFFQLIGGSLSAVTSNPIIGTAAIAMGVGIAALAAPAFGAAFAAALIGGGALGVIGLGAWLLKDDPKVKAAADKLGKTAKTVFVGAAQPLVEPFERSLGIFDQLLKDIAPDLTEMFTAISPAVEPLAKGIAGFVKEMMPGLIDLIKAGVPFLKDLEHTLPRFGEHISKFLTLIADSGPGATDFFRDFLHLIGLLLIGVGVFVNVLSNMYGTTRTIILGIIDVFIMMQKLVQIAIEALVAVFRRWYEFWRDVFFKARRDSDGFVGFMKALPGKVWDAIKEAPTKIKNAFASAGEWLSKAGERIISGLIRGIKNAIPGLESILDWVTDKIPDWKGPPEKDRELLKPTGQMIMQGLGRGLASGAREVRADLGDMTERIPSAITPPAATGATAVGGITINIHTNINRWSEVPSEVIAQLDTALSRYRKAYA